jgi:hypothetical protein
LPAQSKICVPLGLPEYVQRGWSSPLLPQICLLWSQAGFQFEPARRHTHGRNRRAIAFSSRNHVQNCGILSVSHAVAWAFVETFAILKARDAVQFLVAAPASHLTSHKVLLEPMTELIFSE